MLPSPCGSTGSFRPGAPGARPARVLWGCLGPLCTIVPSVEGCCGPPLGCRHTGPKGDLQRCPQTLCGTFYDRVVIAGISLWISVTKESKGSQASLGTASWRFQQRAAASRPRNRSSVPARGLVPALPPWDLSRGAGARTCTVEAPGCGVGQGCRPGSPAGEISGREWVKKLRVKIPRLNPCCLVFLLHDPHSHMSVHSPSTATLTEQPGGRGCGDPTAGCGMGLGLTMGQRWGSGLCPGPAEGTAGLLPWDEGKGDTGDLGVYFHTSKYYSSSCASLREFFASRPCKNPIGTENSVTSPFQWELWKLRGAPVLEDRACHSCITEPAGWTCLGQAGCTLGKSSSRSAPSSQGGETAVGPCTALDQLSLNPLFLPELGGAQHWARGPSSFLSCRALGTQPVSSALQTQLPGLSQGGVSQLPPACSCPPQSTGLFV